MLTDSVHLLDEVRNASNTTVYSGLLPVYGAFFVVGFSSYAVSLRLARRYVLAHGCERITLRDITRAYKPWARLLPRERKDVLGLLVESSWLEPAGRGWTVNPAVHTDFAELAEIERQRREEARKRIGSVPARMPKDE